MGGIRIGMSRNPELHWGRCLMRIWLFPSPGANLARPSSSLVKSHDQEKERNIMLLDDNSSRALNKPG